MPYRFMPPVPEEIYHVFNRSVARQPIFLKQSDFQRMYDLIDYYRHPKPSFRFSHYHRLVFRKRISYLQNLHLSGNIGVKIFAFSLMPNHFHLLIRSTKEGVVSYFLSQIQNSYAKYYNTKYDRNGAVFQSMFKCVRMETDAQFLHVHRYIHLNPLTSFLIKTSKNLETHPWTSYPDYLGVRKNSFVTTNAILSQFSSQKAYKKFIEDQVDYQRHLEEIKHLLLK